jgi:hypothetical protein
MFDHFRTSLRDSYFSINNFSASLVRGTLSLMFPGFGDDKILPFNFAPFDKLRDSEQGRTVLHWDFVGEFTPNLHHFAGWVMWNSSLDPFSPPVAGFSTYKEKG